MQKEQLNQIKELLKKFMQFIKKIFQKNKNIKFFVNLPIYKNDLILNKNYKLIKII